MKRHFPFLWITVFFIVGILLSPIGRSSAEYIALLSVLVLIGAYFFRRRKIVFCVFILIEFLFLGWLWSHERWLFADDHIYFYRQKAYEGPITLRGIIDTDVRAKPSRYSKRLSFVLNLREIKTADDWQSVSGKVLVNLFQDLPLKYGDEMVLTGKLHYPFEFSQNRKFSYRQYLKRQGIIFVLSVKKDSPVQILGHDKGSWLLDKLYRIRNSASCLLAQSLAPPEASLMQAMLLGERLNIPDSLKEVFSQTGTAHILAISGLNVGIVVMVLFLLLRMIPSAGYWTYGLTMFFVALYVLLTGASPSVVRAGMMSMVFLGSFVIERETDSINSLAFAAFLILLLDPQNIFDIGFQLSFISVLSILIFYPLLMATMKPFLKRHPQKILKFVLETFFVSLSATLGVAGLLAYYFEIVTPVSLLANMIVVPLSTLATILGIGLLLCGGVIPFFATCITFALNLMVWFMALCQKLPLAYHYFKDVNICSVISYYCAVIALGLWLHEKVSPSSIDKVGQL